MEKTRAGWRFSDQEKKDFDLILKRTAQREREQFIHKFERLCDEIKSCLLDFPNRNQVTHHQKEALKVFKKALLFTEKILSGKKFLCDFAGIPDLSDSSSYDRENPQPYRDQSNLMSYLRFAGAVRQPLQKMVALLEKDMSRKYFKGRPRADNKNFIKNMAEVYRRYIGKPSSYPYGAFYAVVSIALEASGLPSKNPGRGINAPLKT